MESRNDTTSTAPCLAILGTGSDVGKSIVTAALCRALANRGVRVAPYKAQNMSNNSGVTPEGLEMGRAQIVQAEAARIPPHVDMNPVLLKPTSEVGSQVVLMGKATENVSAMDYHEKKHLLFRHATEALDRLRADYDAVVMEGAGSCAEVNLMDSDIVNLNMAQYADAPVILVADIHRGGVFAQIVGTLACLPETFQHRINGFIINRFRGDIRLFTDGVQWIEQKTGKPVFGVLPWFDHFRIEAEDSVVIEQPKTTGPEPGQWGIGIVRLPHISNFTDFDPLFDLHGVHVGYLEQVTDLSRYRAIILPGSKNTRWDLDWLHTSGWTEAIQAFAQHGGHVLGICGGYQMMGQNVHDPDGVEGSPGVSPGLGLLPVETWMIAPKTTTRTRFRWEGFEGTGYEIHMGQTPLSSNARPLLEVMERNQTPCTDWDGCITEDGTSMGTYMHGFFDTPAITQKWLSLAGLSHIRVSGIYGPDSRDQALNQLAEHFEAHVDMDRIMKLFRR